ncbi:MAG: PD-(D/E)XK nuclease family protein [Bacteroidales bacterium]|nr:PD-(D/E)XK nuclease family protein [Bacteroidales bacterium]
MSLFKKDKTKEPEIALADMPSIFMIDDSEGDHGKESMLDFQLSYLLRVTTTESIELSKRVLMKLIGETPQMTTGFVENFITNLDVESVKVWKQWQRIDLTAEIDADCGSGVKHHVVVVENKAYTGIHDDQLSRYAETIEDYYKTKDVIIHYWVITFFDNGSENYEAIANQCKEAKGNWKCISFEDLVELTEYERQEGTNNQIIDEFWVKYWS